MEVGVQIVIPIFDAILPTVATGTGEDCMSVTTYARLRCPVEEGLDRYGRWIGAPEVAPRQLVRERDVIDLALADGEWKGLAVFVYASGPWTVIEELSGGLGVRSAASWVELAGGGDLVYAAFNDTVPYAQLIVVERGRLVREFLQDEQDPSQDVNVGQLPEEARERIETWIDGAQWVEGDELQLTRAEEGWLWIHRAE
jgi:hypothetical protein